ncbi:hypothetical protein QE152_g11015 [Popillia japonica]
MVIHIYKLQTRFSPTRLEVRRMAFHQAEQLKIQHKFDRQSELAGYDWLSSFLRRHSTNLIDNLNSQRRISWLQFGRLIGVAWGKSATVQNAASGFKACTDVETNEAPAEVSCQEEGAFFPQPSTSHIAELAELPAAQIIDNVCIPSKITHGKALDIVSPVPPAAVLDVFLRKLLMAKPWILRHRRTQEKSGAQTRDGFEETKTLQEKCCDKHRFEKGKTYCEDGTQRKIKKNELSWRNLLMKIWTFLFMTAARTWKITMTQPVPGVGKSIPRQPELMIGFSAPL